MCGIWGVIQPSGLSVQNLELVQNLGCTMMNRGIDGTGIMRQLSNNKLDIYKALEPCPFTMYSLDGDNFIFGSDREKVEYITQAKEKAWRYEHRIRAHLMHTRAATKGKVDEDNIHPPEGGNYTRYIGQHNGTAEGAYFDGDNDSAWIFRMINAKGIKDGIQHCIDKSFSLAFTLVIYDKKTGDIHFIRNSERPIAMCMTNQCDTLVYASTEDHLHFAMDKYTSGVISGIIPAKIMDNKGGGAYKTFETHTRKGKKDRDIFTLEPGVLMTVKAGKEMRIEFKDLGLRLHEDYWKQGYGKITYYPKKDNSWGEDYALGGTSGSASSATPTFNQSQKGGTNVAQIAQTRAANNANAPINVVTTMAGQAKYLDIKSHCLKAGKSMFTFEWLDDFDDDGKFVPLEEVKKTHEKKPSPSTQADPPHVDALVFDDLEEKPWHDESRWNPQEGSYYLCGTVVPAEKVRQHMLDGCAGCSVNYDFDQQDPFELAWITPDTFMCKKCHAQHNYPTV